MDIWAASLPHAAATHPHRVALEADGAPVTYEELGGRAERAARRLAARGVRAADRVALLLAPGPAFVEALHACWLLDAVAMPVDTRLGALEREAQTATAAVIVEEPLDGPEAETPLLMTHAADRVATVVHTSGTTGAPKPVELTFGNWAASARGSAAGLGVGEEERWLCALPLAHVGGLSIPIRSAIYGTTVVLHERYETDRVAAALSGDGITLTSLVPTMLARLLDAGLERPPTLRCAVMGGAPLARDLCERAAATGVPLVQTYGLAESCSQVTLSAIGEPETAGRALPGSTVEISPDGEILVGGPVVAPGALADDGLLHTGDLGELDETGRLRVTGRAADTIVTGGENVAPAEVEATLTEHPAVAEALVRGRPDPEWGEAVVATVVLAAGAVASEEELRDHCRARLAGFKVPKAIDVAAELPRTVRQTSAPSARMTPFDAEQYRAASHEQWEHSAAGWAAQREALQRASMPVSAWMIEAVAPQPGQTVLELAAGPGDTGLMAAELVAPAGRLICSDFAEPMLDVARSRAAELGLENVDFRVLNAESLDLETGAVDAILCRWGYMLMADPAAALRESRRVLRPGGRLALAAWDAPDRNPWISAAGDEMASRGHAPPRDPDAPSMFAFAPPGRIEELLADAGFTDARVEPLDFTTFYDDVEHWWALLLDCGRPFAQLVAKLDPEEAAAARDAAAERLAQYTQPDGRLAVPARTLVAAASA